MTAGLPLQPDIQPVILAGGLGSRLSPRTRHLPKPLLPVGGRPILWYCLAALRGVLPRQPIVCVDYLGDLITSYFYSSGIEFRRYPGATMAEAILSVAENIQGEAILGMSADVLIGVGAVKETLATFVQSGHLDTVLFSQLDRPGHKRWMFHVDRDVLCDVSVGTAFTPIERLLLVMRRDSLLRIRHYLGPSVTEDTVPPQVRGFQTGWNLLLKSMCVLGMQVRAAYTNTPVCNINVASDFAAAEQFVATHRLYAENT